MQGEDARRALKVVIGLGLIPALWLFVNSQTYNKAAIIYIVIVAIDLLFLWRGKVV